MLGLLDSASGIATGIVAGLYRSRAPADGTVVAYAGPDAIAELADQASATRKNSASRSRRTPPRATGSTGPSPAESGRPSAHRTPHAIDGSGQSDDREPVKELDCGHRRLAQRGGLVIDDRGYSFGIGMDQLQHEVVR